MTEGAEQGALTEAVYYILLSLLEPMHGYGIMQNVRHLSRGRMNLGPGTLYGAINTLLEKNWIRAVEPVPGSRRKEYVITLQGIEAVKREIERLKELLENGQAILEDSI